MKSSGDDAEMMIKQKSKMLKTHLFYYESHESSEYDQFCKLTSHPTLPDTWRAWIAWLEKAKTQCLDNKLLRV